MPGATPLVLWDIGWFADISQYSWSFSRNTPTVSLCWLVFSSWKYLFPWLKSPIGWFSVKGRWGVGIREWFGLGPSPRSESFLRWPRRSKLSGCERAGARSLHKLKVVPTWESGRGGKPQSYLSKKLPSAKHVSLVENPKLQKRNAARLNIVITALQRTQGSHPSTPDPQTQGNNKLTNRACPFLSSMHQWD